MTLEAALALIAELQAQHAAMQTENARLQAENAALTQRVAALEAGARLPPSWVKANRKPRAAATGPRRRRAAEQNHGRPRGEPTACVQHAYAACPDCGYPLRGQAVRRRRAVLEIPEAAVTLTEHQILTRYCPACAAYKTPRVSFAGMVLGQGRIGVRLASLIGALRTSYRLPLAQIQSLLAAVHGVHRSLGGVQDILARLRRQLAPVHGQIVAQTRASPVLHMDETGWRQNGQNGYLWVQATDGPPATRLYTYDRSRSGQVARDLLADFGGVLSTDFYAVYDQYAGPQQRCWAHLLRDAHALGEAYPNRPDVREWVAALKGLFTGARNLDLAACTQRERAKVARELERRTRALATCYRHTADHPARVLAQRLHRYESELFEFLRTPGVSPTNNLAERTVRPQVIIRKISGGSRSPDGSAIRCDLATLFQTWAARGLNPFAACLDALQTPSPQL
ncbi:MAG TPA: IS66 family transposase [Chloroflexota bacterium]|nr:IS66 family transposase [Chloroflexota bacterium]